MGDYLTLLGAESVQRAGNNIRDAADKMERAAAEFREAVESQKLFMVEWLEALEVLLVNTKES